MKLKYNAQYIYKVAHCFSLTSGGQRLPAVVALPDRSGILIAQRQEVEELSHVEQGFDVVLKSAVSHS